MEYLRRGHYFLPADGQFVFSSFSKDFDAEALDALQAVDKKMNSAILKFTCQYEQLIYDLLKIINFPISRLALKVVLSVREHILS